MIKSINNKKKKKGFTLIELIIVLAVLAIIAAIAIPNFIAVEEHSKVKSDNASCESIKRTTMALVADGTVTDDNYAVSISGSTVTVKNAAGTEQTDLESQLSGIKSPQAKNKTGYQITVASGNVTVSTTP
ncbi:prepilin-type N-terminal cleavage/methylation domain-containing protein [Clostridium sp. 19966]|uniref:prepilin-type N-terminal cleavage/methylation domain-containing protein n=1 Tax=Clostridium sp. 19966 TaxID=2768166 RepID=UPI0028DD5E89|nr:prepilin-type N-terminal cleavage/methylation domain-containing protein [Clostridium sp. 19966]MDT8715484.1 prepilin-type N-terminal cleavage/methylation domain-containing protein [Clostridium sp. 19966]